MDNIKDNDIKQKYDDLLAKYNSLNDQLNPEEDYFLYLETIANNIDAIVTVYNIENYEVLFLNEYGKAINGEVRDKRCWEFLHGNEFGPCSFCPNERLTDDKGKSTGVYIWESYHPSTLKWFENHTQVVTINDKKLNLEISYDITFRKKDEKRILKLLNQQNVLFDIASNLNSTNTFESIIENTLSLIGKQLTPSKSYIWELDSENNIVNIFEWRGKNTFKSINILKDLNLSDYDFPFREILKNGRIKSANISQVFHNEALSEKFTEIGILSILLVPLYIDNHIIGILGIDNVLEKRMWHSLEINLLKTISELISNVYKRKYYQEEILASQKKLEEVNASKDKFFSIIAHDLKNPVYNLISLSDFLIQNIDTWKIEKTKEFVKYINDSSKQGFNLLENLLVWSRSQTGKISQKPVKFNLSEIIRDNLHLHKNSAISKNIELTSNNCNESYVYADINMTSTVVRNLISNAIKYTPEGGKIIVHCQLISTDAGAFRKITVEDSGVGIAEKDIPKLFVIDKNFSTPGTRDEKGTGLGLILCHEFVIKNHGEIWVESQVGKGSKFIFTVPSAEINNED